MGTDKQYDASSRVYNFFSTHLKDVWDLVKITGLFLLFSLPIVTVFASYGATVRCLVKLEQKDKLSVWKVFWEYFKKEFGWCTLVGTLCLLTMAACVVSGTYYYVISEGSAFQYVSVIFFALLFAFAFLFFICYYIVRASVDVPFSNCLKNTASLIALSLMVDLALCVVIALMVVLIYLKQSLLIFLPLLLVLYMRLCVFSYYKQIRKYMLIPEDES